MTSSTKWRPALPGYKTSGVSVLTLMTYSEAGTRVDVFDDADAAVSFIADMMRNLAEDIVMEDDEASDLSAAAASRDVATMISAYHRHGGETLVLECCDVWTVDPTPVDEMEGSFEIE